MAKGRIILRKLDLMGYTPATQVWLVENGGGAGARAVMRALLADAKDGALLHIQHMGALCFGVRGMEAARIYADRASAIDGFVVRWA